MTAEESSQWLFTQDEISSSPSIIDGLSITEERCRRAKGVNFITQVGILLKLPQVTLAVASVFFHRFYMRWSMVSEKQSGGIHHYVRPNPSQTQATWKLPHSKFHTDSKAKDASLTFESPEQNIAATALFLATKTEEHCRKTKEIIIAVAKVAQKNADLIIDEQSKEYWRWRDNILTQEELLLEQLTFDVNMKSPYNIFYDFIQKLKIQDNKPLRNVAWAFLNDSCLTTLCLLMPARDIAIAAIYFAATFHAKTIPDDTNGRAWWEQLGGQPEKITEAVGVMSNFWSENPLRRSENPLGEYPSPVDDLDRTRRRGSRESFSSGIASQAPSPNSQPDVKPEKRASQKRKSDDEPQDEPVLRKARSEDSQ